MSKKKYSVIDDELNIQGDAIYAIFPYNHLDEDGKGAFKLGFATNIRKRIENYHTTFPEGLYLIAFLNFKFYNKIGAKKQRLKIIENKIFKRMEEMGAMRLKATTRSNKEGQTEWFYTDTKTIHRAFHEINEDEKKKGTEYFYNLNKVKRIGKSTDYFRGEITHQL